MIISDFDIKYAYNIANSPAVKSMAYGNRLATIIDAMKNGTFYELTLGDLMDALEIEITDDGFTCPLTKGVYPTLEELSEVLVNTTCDYPIECFIACTIDNMVSD